MANSFIEYFWNLLPPYLRQDNLNDPNGKPFLQRYLKNFEDEMDENFRPFVDNFIDIFDVLLADEKYIPYISYVLGNPPSIGKDLATYRKLLSYIIDIYKIKGTIQSFKLVFDIVGIDIDIIEEVPKRGSTYDVAEVIYDFDDADPYLYDTNCENCSGFTITYPVGTDTTIFDTLADLVNFLTPINAKFLGYQQQ